MSASATTSREPESAIIRASSPAVDARVDRYGDRLRAQHAEVGRDELDPVAERDHHPVAGDDPGRAEPGRDPADLVVELRPGQAASAGLDDRQLRPAAPAAALGHQVGDVVQLGHGARSFHTPGRAPAAIRTVSEYRLP